MRSVFFTAKESCGKRTDYAGISGKPKYKFYFLLLSVEVGVNVPNATVMLIENAERFGMSQLHQLRGRVGRGKWQSYCIFLNGSEDSCERLDFMASTNDGFLIAEQDMKMRGVGEFFGEKQSGDTDFKLADIYKDTKLLQLATEAAEQFEK